jgi:hypothetical protein
MSRAFSRIPAMCSKQREIASDTNRGVLHTAARFAHLACGKFGCAAGQCRGAAGRLPCRVGGQCIGLLGCNTTSRSLATRERAVGVRAADTQHGCAVRVRSGVTPPVPQAYAFQCRSSELEHGCASVQRIVLAGRAASNSCSALGPERCVRSLCSALGQRQQPS